MLRLEGSTSPTHTSTLNNAPRNTLRTTWLLLDSLIAIDLVIAILPVVSARKFFSTIRTSNL